MGSIINRDINAEIIEFAIKLRASVAGIANVSDIKKSPSYILVEKLDGFGGVQPIDPGDATPGQIDWPDNADSAVVVGVKHLEDKPELDWWQEGLRGGTPGNSILMDITSKLSDWLEKEMGYKTHKLPYHVENGGVFLKDAAVMAGLGCIGKNNLCVTPDYGPRVRLRAILLDADLPASGAIGFNPCNGCDMPCRTICPQGAFQKKVYRNVVVGIKELPGRNGVYSRQLCNDQMIININNSKNFKTNMYSTPGRLIKYCRKCEFACPVGKV